MRTLTISILSLVTLFFSCKKELDAPPRPNESLITYEVITSSGTWFGEYFNEKQERLYTSPPAGVFVPQPSGWKFNFRPAFKPIQLYCHATSTCICTGTPTSPDVTVNIYVDGNLMATQKNNWAKGVTSVVYDLQ